MSDKPTDITSLEARVEAMRRLGVLEWGDIKLGPVPPSGADGDDETQRLTPAEAEQRARDERKRVSMASSGGPLRRLADD